MSMSFGNIISSIRCYSSQSPVQSSARAIGALIVLIVVVIKTPSWLLQSTKSSPLLAFNLMLIICIFLSQLWRKCGGDINATGLRLVLATMQGVAYIREEFFVLTTSGIDPSSIARKKRRRKLLRSAIFFILVQHALALQVQFLWLHSLLAFEFITEFFQFLSNGFQYDDRNSQLPANLVRYIQQGYQLSKGLLAANVLFYQFFYISRVYFVVTVIYFILVQKYLEKPITKLLELLQCELFEGLEQYYVSCFLALIELFLCFVFSLLILFENKQYLMLLALYTNIYLSFKEFSKDTMPSAFAAWAYLAQFERATREELDELDDVCAICLCTMRSARRTPCNHLFHGHCLRKALKSKAMCPMCTSPIK